MIPRTSLFAVLAATVALAACGGHGGSLPSSGSGPGMPQSISPGLIQPAPMAKTAILPASAMRSPTNRHVDSVGRGWTQIPGTASQVAAAGDGSLWVLSDQPAGADKYIWHYVNGNWTNISGLATKIAPSVSGGMLYAINSGGGLWAYNGTSWQPLGGGARDLTVANDGMGDGSPYVLSNGGSGPDYAIWKNAGGYGTWSQVNGIGTSLAGTFDTNGYTIPSGTFQGGGIYILNSSGAIWFENPDTSFASLPGNASAIVPAAVGAYALGYPSNASGNVLYYYDYLMPGWIAEQGSGVSMSANYNDLYVVGASGAIYKTAAAGFVFGGGTVTQTFTPTGGSVTMPASGNYDNISTTLQWGSNSASSNFNFTASWALGSDLPATFIALPSSIGTPVMYMQWTTDASVKVTFTDTPAVTVTTTASFPGTKCGFAFYGNGPAASAYQWTSMTMVGLSEVTPSGNTFTIPSQPLSSGNSVEVSPGENLRIALYCH